MTLYKYWLRDSERLLYINGVLEFENNKNDMAGWRNFPSEGISTMDEITIVMSQSDKDSYDEAYGMMLDNLGSGTESALIHKQIKKNSVSIILSIIVIIMGIASIVALAGFTFLKVPETKGYFSCGLLLIVGRICTFINYDYITLIIKNDALVNNADFLTQVLIVELLLVYLSDYLNTPKYERNSRVMSVVWIMCIYTYYILKACNFNYEREMISVMIIIALIMYSILAFYLIKDFSKYKERRTKYVIISSGILLLTVGIEIIHYYITNSDFALE